MTAFSLAVITTTVLAALVISTLLLVQLRRERRDFEQRRERIARLVLDGARSVDVEPDL